MLGLAVVAMSQMGGCLGGNLDNGSVVLPTTSLVSRSTTGVASNQSSLAPSVSADGRFVVFESDATNLVESDTNGLRDVFVRDTVSGTTTLVSENSQRTGPGDGNSFGARISSDGRFVAFISFAGNLVSGIPEAAGTHDCFLRDLQAGRTVYVSLKPDGTISGESVFVTDVVADATDAYVVFDGKAAASTLVTGLSDSGATEDIFLRKIPIGNMGGGTTLCVSLQPGLATTGTGSSTVPSLGQDSENIYVAYQSTAKDLVTPNTLSGLTYVYWRPVTKASFSLGTTLHASRKVGGNAATNYASNGNSTAPAISADGRYVVFQSTASDMVATADANGAAGVDVFVAGDMKSGSPTTILASLHSAGTQGELSCTSASISGDGRFVVFQSGSTDLVDGDGNGKDDIFRRDLQTGTTIRASLGADALEANGQSSQPRISADGRNVVFVSKATNLSAADTNFGTFTDIFLRTIP